MQVTWPTFVSVANMLCRLTTTMLHAPNVGWLLAIVVWILEIPALPVKDGLGSSGRKQWAKLRRSLIDARARAEQRGKQHWTVACPHVEAWILAKPASTSASEISSQAGEGDFDDERLVDTPKQHEVQVLVVQSQKGANMATGSTPTAAGTTITAQSTAASTAAYQEPIVEQLGQDTPSVTQGARPKQKYGSQPYFSDQQYTAAGSITAAQPYTAVPQPYIAAVQPYIAPYNICLLCQLGLLSQWDILARAGSYLLC